MVVICGFLPLREAVHGWNVTWSEVWHDLRPPGVTWSEASCSTKWETGLEFSYQCINIRSSPGAAVRQTPLTPWCHLSLSSPSESKASLSSQHGDWIRISTQVWREQLLRDSVTPKNEENLLSQTLQFSTGQRVICSLPLGACNLCRRKSEKWLFIVPSLGSGSDSPYCFPPTLRGPWSLTTSRIFWITFLIHPSGQLCDKGTITDAQAQADRAWVTSAGKCQDGMRSHPSPSLRTQSSRPFRRWAFRAGKMVTRPWMLSHSTHSPTPLGEEEDRDEILPLLPADLSIWATCIGSSLKRRVRLGQKLRCCP